MHPSFASLRAALFDLDGTLVRTHIDFPALRAAAYDLAKACGVEDAVAGESDILQIVALGCAALPSYEGEKFRRAAFAALEELEMEGCAHPDPIDASEELLSRLRTERKMGIGIITRNSRRVAEKLLQRTALTHDILIAREDTPEFKPHPAPLLRACQFLGTIPAETSMTGDLWVDIAAGRAAGVAVTVGIRWPEEPEDRFAKCRPDFEIRNLTDALPLFLPVNSDLCE